MMSEIEEAITFGTRVIKTINSLLRFTGYELVKINRPVFELCPYCGNQTLRKEIFIDKFHAVHPLKPDYYVIEYCDNPQCSHHKNKTKTPHRVTDSH